MQTNGLLAIRLRWKIEAFTWVDTIIVIDNDRPRVTSGRTVTGTRHQIQALKAGTPGEFRDIVPDNFAE